jgi:hypothetical protein
VLLGVVLFYLDISRLPLSINLLLYFALIVYIFFEVA